MGSVESAVIRIAVGSVMAAYGMNQMTNPKSWEHYEPGWLKKLLPVSPGAFMQSHGSVNVGLGLLFMSGWRIGFVSWATYAWWLSILPFVARQDWREGARDFAIIAAVLAVAIGASRR